MWDPLQSLNLVSNDSKHYDGEALITAHITYPSASLPYHMLPGWFRLQPQRIQRTIKSSPWSNLLPVQECLGKKYLGPISTRSCLFSSSPRCNPSSKINHTPSYITKHSDILDLVNNHVPTFYKCLTLLQTCHSAQTPYEFMMYGQLPGGETIGLDLIPGYHTITLKVECLG